MDNTQRCNIVEKLLHILYWCVQVMSDGIHSTPLNLAVYWKCTASTTDLRIDYRYNPESMDSPSPLTNVQILVPVDGGVTNMQSLPNSIWWDVVPLGTVSRRATCNCYGPAVLIDLHPPPVVVMILPPLWHFSHAMAQKSYMDCQMGYFVRI